MKIKLNNCQVRSWKKEDADSVAHHANNKKIWIDLRDRFPHPYSLADARQFIQMAMSRDPETYFCISRGDEAIGSIGFGILSDVARFSAEIGYWLGEKYWGRGIMTKALNAVTHYALTTHGLHRVFALPYEWNRASMRVLEKAGYQCEGRMRRSSFKDGKLIDQFLYAFTRE